MIPYRSIAAVTLVLLNGVAVAQSVYRCGQTYQDSPCPDGKVVDVSDERSDEQRESARAVTEKEAARGNALERSRLAEEKARRVPPVINLSPRAKPTKSVSSIRPSPPPRHIKKKAAKARAASKKP